LSVMRGGKGLRCAAPRVFAVAREVPPNNKAATSATHADLAMRSLQASRRENDITPAAVVSQIAITPECRWVLLTALRTGTGRQKLRPRPAYIPPRRGHLRLREGAGRVKEPAATHYCGLVSPLSALRILAGGAVVISRSQSPPMF